MKRRRFSVNKLIVRRCDAFFMQPRKIILLLWEKESTKFWGWHHPTLRVILLMDKPTNRHWRTR